MQGFTKILAGVFNFLLFVLVLFFAISNTAVVDLRFAIGGFTWRAPLVLFLLVFFAAGTLVGLLTSVPPLLRQRYEIVRLNKALKRLDAQSPPESDLQPPL